MKPFLERDFHTEKSIFEQDEYKNIYMIKLGMYNKVSDGRSYFKTLKKLFSNTKKNQPFWLDHLGDLPMYNLLRMILWICCICETSLHTRTNTQAVYFHFHVPRRG